MSELKTQPNDGDVLAYINTVEPAVRHEDSHILLELFQRVLPDPPKMWGNSLIGYGKYDYTYKSGRTGSWFLTGFAPRKASMSIYIMPGFSKYQSFLDKLGPHKHSVSCLYITRLAKVDLNVLESLIKHSVDDMRDMYPER